MKSHATITFTPISKRTSRPAGIADSADGSLFRTTGRKTGKPHPMRQQDVYSMIQRRARAAGIKTETGCHNFRATSITAYLSNKGRSSWRSSSPTTPRRQDAVSVDEVERIAI